MFKLLSLMVLLAISFTNIFSFNVLAADDDTSFYLELENDTTVWLRNKTILTKTISLQSTSKIFLQSDGRYYPSGNACASMQIYVDSVGVSNTSITDWQNATSKAQHSYNCIAEVTLPSGTHTISLVARPIAGTFKVGAGSNLCILMGVTVNMQSSTLSADTQTYNFTTYGCNNTTAVPHSPIISSSINNSSGPIIALGSARAYSSVTGDKMLGIYDNGEPLPNNQGMWTVNDYWSAIETQAPMYTHAYINETGNHTISLDATEFPWNDQQGEDPAQYKVGAASKLVVLNGSMRVSGSAPQSTTVNNCWEWVGVGTGDGTPVAIATETINIPSGHNGVVMFEAKTRFQPNINDLGGDALLWIEIDGVRRGSTGVQQFISGSTESQRTVCASYLTAGQNALSVGNHTVKVCASAVGSFWQLAAVKDLPLVWFDGKSGNPAPSAFQLTSPLGDYISNTPVFRWENSTYADSYTLTVSPNSDFSNPIISQSGITQNSYTCSTELSYNTNYYWKVDAVNSYGSTINTDNYVLFKTAASENLLDNSSFESGMDYWNTSGNFDADFVQQAGYDGPSCLTHWNSADYSVYTYQTLTGLTNGLYTLTAWVKSNVVSGQGINCMEAINYGGNSTYAIPPEASEWEMIVLKDINVTNGQCTIGFYSGTLANYWYSVDDVNFFKQN